MFPLNRKEIPPGCYKGGKIMEEKKTPEIVQETVDRLFNSKKGDDDEIDF